MALEEELQSLIFTGLIMDSPVLSGNMQTHIQYEGYYDNGYTISISGPSYDMNEWKKNGRIILTNEYDYAISVNRLGAFGGRSKKSQYWAYRSVMNKANVVCSNYGAELIVDLKGL